MSENSKDRAKRLIRRWDSFGNELDLPLETNLLIREIRAAEEAAEKRGHAAGVAEERERCARLLDEWPAKYPTDVFTVPPKGEHGKTVDGCSAQAIRVICPSIAAAIREEEEK